MTEEVDSEGVPLEALRERIERMKQAIGAVVVGQEGCVEELLVGLFCGGHVLLEGVPGIAKTLMARCLTEALGLEFRRIQFTPDLTPADVTGTNLFDFKSGTFNLQKGPVFANVLLADEINRTPPKTQAALLEAMEERQVTIDGVSHRLPDPFFVIATQNPLEHEGTYPLPEAQLDRFLLKVRVSYPEREAETEIYRRFLAGRIGLTAAPQAVERVLGESELATAREALGRVAVDEKVIDYAAAIVAESRSSAETSLGGSPRAGIALLATARARAALDGREFALPDDVKRMAVPVMRHRIILTPEAELEGLSPERVLERIVEKVEVPRE